MGLSPLRPGTLSAAEREEPMTTKGTVKVGTSGYSFADWQTVFYPPRLPKAKMLDYYATQFDTVEINATYYRIPPPPTFASMVRRTKPHFEFMVKAHESLTHKRHQVRELTPVFRDAIAPLAESGRLKGILAQFPWSFVRNPQNLDHIRTCRELLIDYNLFVEFRHASWIRTEIFDLLRALEIGFVSVDEPQLEQMVPPVAVATIPVGYVRFHGRNADKWYSGEGSDRYDYLYSESELQEWITKIEALRLEAKTVYLFFNNCHHGQAVTNARQILEMLDVS